MKKSFIFVLVLLTGIVVLSLLAGRLTSFASQGSTLSNVSVDVKFISISFSEKLSGGISFEEVSSLPATNVNATNNYNGAEGASMMFISVSEDSSTDVDLCIKADAGLTDAGGDVIGLGNETYGNSSSTDINNPALSGETSLTTGYVKSSGVVAPGGDNYYRFWLDVPSGTEAGTYNNTISFKGVETTASC